MTLRWPLASQAGGLARHVIAVVMPVRESTSVIQVPDIPDRDDAASARWSVHMSAQSQSKL